MSDRTDRHKSQLWVVITMTIQVACILGLIALGAYRERSYFSYEEGYVAVLKLMPLVGIAYIVPVILPIVATSCAVFYSTVMARRAQSVSSIVFAIATVGIAIGGLYVLYQMCLATQASWEIIDFSIALLVVFLAMGLAIFGSSPQHTPQ